MDGLRRKSCQTYKLRLSASSHALGKVLGKETKGERTQLEVDYRLLCSKGCKPLTPQHKFATEVESPRTSYLPTADRS